MKIMKCTGCGWLFIVGRKKFYGPIFEDKSAEAARMQDVENLTDQYGDCHLEELMTTFEIQLSCGHRKTIKAPAPERGDAMWCLGCNAEKTVKAAPGAYRAKCLKKSCRYSSRKTVKVEPAIVSAKKHTQSRSTHTVGVFDGSIKIREITNVEDLLITGVDELREVRDQGLIGEAYTTSKPDGQEEIPF